MWQGQRQPKPWWSWVPACAGTTAARFVPRTLEHAGFPLPRDEQRGLLLPHSHIQLSNSRTPCGAQTSCIQAKGISAPVHVAGRGDSPDFRFLPSPSNRGGWRADKAQCPDYSGRGVRLTPDDGCTTVHPRLAARQRGILAFMPLTVVGPGRLLVADEAARVPPGDGGCVRPSLAGAAPVPRLQDAS
jgi:hypothetical protein